MESSKYDEACLSDNKEDSVADDRQEDVEDEGEGLLPQVMARSFLLEDECATMTIDNEPSGEAPQQINDDSSVTKTDNTVCSDMSNGPEEMQNAIATLPPSQTAVVDDVNDLPSETQPPHVSEEINDDQTSSMNCTVDESSGDASHGEVETSNITDTIEASVTNPRARLLTCSELLDLFRSLCSKVVQKKAGEPVVIGMVGYPNVGKSSTINTLIQAKKVPVSATPGRTKHFQVSDC